MALASIALVLAMASVGAMPPPRAMGGHLAGPAATGAAAIAVLAAAEATAQWTKESQGPAKRACAQSTTSCLHAMRLGHLVDGDAEDDYKRLAQDLRAMVMSPEVRFIRPAPKPKRAGGGKLALGADALVPVLNDKMKHLVQAIHTHSQQGMNPSALAGLQRKAQLSAVVEKTIEDMLELHDKGQLPAWRSERIARFQSIVQRSLSLDARIKDSEIQAEAVIKLGHVRTINVALLVLLVDVLEWPDTTLPNGFLHGFPVVGVIPDSGVHRPFDPTQLRNLGEFHEQSEKVMATNVSWATEVARTVGKYATSAQSGPASGDSDRLELLRAVAAATEKEVHEGWMGPGLTLQELIDKHGRPDGTMNARVMVRHGIYQGERHVTDKSGTKIKGVDGLYLMERKLRCIDDAKTSLSNICQYTYETVSLCSFALAGHVAEVVHRMCTEKGIRMPELAMGTDDMRSAYRQIPCSQQGYTVVCVYTFGKNPGPRFFPVYGFNFGHVSSVVQYNRAPELLVHAARKLFLCVVEHYVDDYATIDVARKRKPDGWRQKVVQRKLREIELLKNKSGQRHPDELTKIASEGALRAEQAGGQRGAEIGVDLDSGAQRALGVLHEAVGLILEPKKHAGAKQVACFLGVTTNLQYAHSPMQPRVVFTPSEKRVQGILDSLETCRSAKNGQGYMSKREAERLFGKLNFLSSHTCGAVGRAATQPLLHRMGKKPYARKEGSAPVEPTNAFDEPMRIMHDFFKILFKHLPPLIVPLGKPRRLPVLIYSDAQYAEAAGTAGLGVILVDLEDPTQKRYMAGGQTSQEVLEWLHQRKQQVNQLELLAVLCASMTFKEKMLGREVIFYIDNTSALSACIHGYCQAPDMGMLSNALALMLAGMACVAYFVHVAGKANPADLPSRAPFIVNSQGKRVLDLRAVVDPDPDQQRRDVIAAEFLNESFIHCELVLPTVQQLSAPEHFIKRS